MSCHFISIESPWSALQLCFCIKVDIMSCWHVNRRNVASVLHWVRKMKFLFNWNSKRKSDNRQSVSRLSTVFAFWLASDRLADVPGLQGRGVNLRESDSYAVGARSHLSAVLRVPAVKVDGSAAFFCFGTCRFPLQHNGATTEKTVAMETAHLESWQMFALADASFAYKAISSDVALQGHQMTRIWSNVASLIGRGSGRPVNVHVRHFRDWKVSLANRWLSFIIIWSNDMPFDSWFPVLPKVFWVQLATTKCSTAKFTRNQEEDAPVISGFSNWRPNASNESESYFEFEGPYREPSWNNRR